jgi:hypothetical protein
MAWSTSDRLGFRGELGVKIRRASRWQRFNPWQRAKDFLRSIWL